MIMGPANCTRWRCCPPNARIKAWPARRASRLVRENWVFSIRASTKPRRCAKLRRAGVTFCCPGTMVSACGASMRRANGTPPSRSPPTSRPAPQVQVEWDAVELGQTQESRLGPVRLIAYRLAEEKANRRRAQLREKCRTHGRLPTEQALELAGWLILLTNAPKELLPTAAAGYVYRVRWQVELIFKQWKSVLRLDVLPSENAFRVQCEVWARLLTALLAFVWYQHANAACLKLHQCEISFSKVAKRLQQQGQSLVRALFGDRAWIKSEFRRLWKRILKLARKERQPSRPTTWENLCTHWLEV